jgi:Lrp/AsnC family transcriptional regulator for asnA, asnC and gidA
MSTAPQGQAGRFVAPELAVRRDLTEFELGLIARLQVDGRLTYAELARQLGVTEKTVRKTLLDLRAQNLIEITAVTYPAMLGYEAMAMVAVTVAPPAQVREVAARLADLKAVDYVAVTSGRYDIFVEIICRDFDELLHVVDEEVRGVAGVAATEVFPYLSLHFQEAPSSARDAGHGSLRSVPTRGADLDGTDRQIVLKLTADGRIPFQTIARQIGLSESLVRQRVRRLTDLGVLRVVAIANPVTLGFDKLAWLGIHGSSSVEELADRFMEIREVTYVVLCAGRYDIFAEVACRDDAELLQLLDKIRGVQGVQGLEAFLYLDLVYKRLSSILEPSEHR